MAQSLSNLKALAYAVAVHIVVIVLLVIGFTWRQDDAGGTKPQPDVVKARVVDSEQVKQEVERLKAEEQRKRKEEAERKQKTAEAEKKRRLEEQLKRKQAEDKKRLAEAEKRRVEQQRMAEEARRKEAEASLHEQLAAEEKARAAARKQRDLTETERYKLLIQQKVTKNWVWPGVADPQLECVMMIRLVPGGEVINVKVTQGSGNPAFDRSVENAVYKATPLPVPADPQLFEEFRDLEFKFKPPKA